MKTKKMKSLAITASLTIFLSGCGGMHSLTRVTGGMQSSQLLLESSGKVKKGMNATEVRSIVGNPASINEMNGMQIWLYRGHNKYTASSFKKTETVSVMITFSPSGRVTKVDKNRTEQGPILMAY